MTHIFICNIRPGHVLLTKNMLHVQSFSAPCEDFLLVNLSISRYVKQQLLVAVKTKAKIIPSSPHDIDI